MGKATRARNKIKELFDRYSSNLSYCFPEAKEIFICPICQDNYTREAIDEGLLSLEHIIPSRLGGRWVTLTCKKCNNEQGTTLDAQIIRRLKVEDILTGRSKSPIRSRITIGDGDFTADVYLSHEGKRNVQIIGIPESSNPERRDRAVTNLESGTLEINLKGDLGYKAVASKVGVIRMAYLMMFSVFGYGYVQANSLDVVRDQIASFNDEKPPLKGVVVLNQPNFHNKIGLLTSPESLRSFFVILKLSTKYSKHYFGVSLPGLDKDSFALYERWDKEINNIVFPANAKIDLLNYQETFITDPKLRFLSKAIWDDLIQIGEPSVDARDTEQ